MPYCNANGEHADFHAMRHTFGTNLARAGVVLKDLQALMDHASPATTARYYSHVTEAELAAAIGKMTMPETDRPESATDAA